MADSTRILRGGAMAAVLLVVLLTLVAVVTSLRVPEQAPPELPGLTAEPPLPQHLPALVPFAAELQITGTTPVVLGVSDPALSLTSDGSLSWLSPEPGTHTIRFTASNAAGLAELIWDVVVTAEPPQITGGPNLTAKPQEAYSSTLAASGTPPLTWQLSDHPPALSIDASSGHLQLPAEAVEPGASWRFTVTVTNPWGSDSCTYTITCQEQQPNEPRPKRTVAVASVSRQPVQAPETPPPPQPEPPQPQPPPPAPQPPPPAPAQDKEVERLQAEQTRLEAEKLRRQAAADAARAEAERRRHEAEKLAHEKVVTEQLAAAQAAQQEAAKRAAEAEAAAEKERQAHLQQIAEQEARLREQLAQEAEQARLAAEQQRLDEERRRVEREAKLERQRIAREQAREAALAAQLEAARQAQEAAQAETIRQENLRQQAKAQRQEKAEAEDRQRQEAERQAQAEAARLQEAQRRQALRQQGKQVDLARYELSWQGSLADFVRVAQSHGIRLLFVSPQSMLPGAGGNQYEVTSVGPEGQPRVQQIGGVTLPSLAANHYSSKYFLLANVPSQGSWQQVDERLRHQLREDGAYQLMGFFPYEFLAVMEQTARAVYQRRANNPATPFQQGAGTVVITLRPGVIDIVSMDGIR